MTKPKPVTLIPLFDKVLIRRLDAQEEKTSGGLIIPVAAQELSHIGIVEAVGPDNDANLKKGDRVIWEKFTGAEVKLDSADYVVIKQNELIGLVKGGA